VSDSSSRPTHDSVTTATQSTASDAQSAGQTATLLGLMRGFVVYKTIYVAAQLNVADKLANGPRHVDDLAREAGVDADALYRILRALASIGVFEAHDARRFGLTALGERLRTGIPGSLRDWFLTNGGPIYGAFTNVLESVRTGRPAFDTVYGASFFDYLRAHPDEGAVFDAAMHEFTTEANRALLASYDYATFAQAVDVGGGDGALVAGLLEAYPHLRGVVFDQDHVVAAARTSPRVGALGSRVRIVGGDFFREVPAGADLYILAWILHDWNDQRAAEILAACRRAIAPGGRLLIVEAIVPDDSRPHFSKFGDIVMMVLFGARERTEAEYQGLLEASGFRLARVIQTGSPRSILEAVPWP
jgi:SAM-dependent methyltransferase